MDIAGFWNEGINALLQKDYRRAEELLLKAYDLKNAADIKTIQQSAHVGMREGGPIIYYHLTLSALIELYFKMRDTWKGAYDKCLRYCHEDLAIIFSDRFLNAETGVPHCLSIDRLAIDYEKKGQYQEAIELCEKAISLGFNDSTKGGYQGRINKLKKKTAAGKG